MIESASLKVTGMKCGGCENNVNTKLKSINGVKSVSASREKQEVIVEYDSDLTDLDTISQAIKNSGYTVVEDN